MREAKIPGKTLVWLQESNGPTSQKENLLIKSICRGRWGYSGQSEVR